MWAGPNPCLSIFSHTMWYQRLWWWFFYMGSESGLQTFYTCLQMSAVLSDHRIFLCLFADANFSPSTFYLFLNENTLAELSSTSSHLFPTPSFFLITHSRTILNLASIQSISVSFFSWGKLCCCSKLCCFLPCLLEKGHRIEGNYTEKCRHLSVLVVWDLKWSCWQFSLRAGHCGAGRFCSEPWRWAWRLRVLPYVGSHWCQQQMCWTMRLKPWTPCLGRGCVHGLLARVEKYAVNKKRLFIKVFKCLCVSTTLSTCLSV